MEHQKRPNAKLRREIEMKLKTAFLMLLAAIISFSSFLGIMTVNAATIGDDGQYTLILTTDDGNGYIDGDYAKVIRFNVADDETTVSLSELTAGTVPFNGETKFAYWGNGWPDYTKADEELSLADFTSAGSIWLADGTEVKYTNGLSLYATFSDEVLKGTGTYYLTLDGFGGTVNGKAKLRLTSSSSEYQTVDLTQYTPVRDGYTFVGWDLDGKFVTSIDSGCFAEKDAVAVTATYTKNNFEGNDRVLVLNANGGTIEGKESNKYDYVGGANSGTSMSLLPYTPVRDGYTFVGWDLDGKFVTSIDSGCFAEKDAVAVTATYTKNNFEGNDRVLVLNANGGTIEGKESNKYDYVGGANSGTSMSLLPYTPVRDGYTFTGWKAKSDGSGQNCNYIYWRAWDQEYGREFEKDTVLYDLEGYIAYQNLTLYASWAKNADTPTEPDEPVTPSKPTQDTVKEIQSTGEIKANIEFADGINKDYRLDIQELEVRKELADKNVKFIADINMLDGDTVVKISDTKMKIRIALPGDLIGYNKYEVVYILNDEIKETIPATVEDGYIVFETSHLSQYGIIATNTGTTAGGSETANQQTDNNGKATQNTDATSPQTGDNSNIAIWFAVLFVSFGGVVGCTVYGRRRKLNN